MAVYTLLFTPSYHTNWEEFFYVLAGELRFPSGERSIRGGPGTFMFECSPRIVRKRMLLH